MKGNNLGRETLLTTISGLGLVNRACAIVTARDLSPKMTDELGFGPLSPGTNTPQVNSTTFISAAASLRRKAGTDSCKLE